MQPFHDRLKELFRYESETGHFYRLRQSSVMCSKSLDPIAGGGDGLGYIRITIDGRKYKAHRLAWFYYHGRWPVGMLDHVNGDRADNRICNLREVTRAENLQNQKRARRDNKLGILGVHRTANGRFMACIGVNGTNRYLGVYKTPELASEVYQLAKQMLHVSQ